MKIHKPCGVLNEGSAKDSLSRSAALTVTNNQMALVLAIYSHSAEKGAHYGHGGRVWAPHLSGFCGDG